MFNLDDFKLEDTYRLAAEVRDLAAPAGDGAPVDELVVSHLFEHLRALESGAPACPLVRLFRTTSWSKLSEELKAGLRPGLGHEPEPHHLFLSLRASRGLVPEWNDPLRSHAHRVLPLRAPDTTPMVSGLVAQLGLSGDGPLTLKTEDKLCDVFHVEQALGSPFVPDQSDFVRRHGIQSVLGFGGLLADNDAFVVLLFSSVPVTRQTADLFRFVAPSVGLALVGTRDDKGAVEHRLRSTEELLRHHERIALAHVRAQRQLAEQLRRSEEETRGHSRELREAIKRVRAHQAVTRAIAESESLSDAALRIMTSLAEALDCCLGYAWQPASTGQKLELIASWPLSTPSEFLEFAKLTRATVFGRGVGLPGRVWASNRPAWLLEVTDDPNFPRARAAREVGLRTGVAFPAVLDGDVVCVFELFARDTRARDDDMLHLLDHVGNQVGQFVARTRARDALVLSDVRKGAVFQAALDCIVSINSAGLITDFNPAAERTFGYRKEDVIGKDMASLLIPPSLRATHRRGLAHYLATGEGRILGKRIDLSALRADQTTFPIELTVTEIDMPDGPMFTAFIRDTTERKRATDERDRSADALRTSEQRFRMLARQAPVGIIAVDLEGRCMFVNERWCKMAGMNSEQAMERGWQEALHPEDRVSMIASFYDATASGADFTARYRLRTRQGKVTWVQAEALPLRNSAGEVTGYLGTVTDITDRIQGERIARFLAEATLALSASLDYETALNAVSRLAVPTLADCCCVHVIEDGAMRLVGVAHADRHTATWANELAHWYSAESDVSVDVGRAIGPEVITECRDEMLPHAVLSPAHAAVWRAMFVRSYVVAPLRARGRLLGAIHLMMGESGRSFAQADLAFVEDLARRAAIAVDNALLYRQAQEAAVSRESFLTIASHELRTPLTTLSLAVQQLVRWPMTQSSQATWTPVVRKIDRATKRMTFLAEDLVNFARMKGTRLQLSGLDDVDLVKIVEDMIEDMEDEISRSGSKLTVHASGPAVGHWERRRLEQVITNLLTNAVKFGAHQPIVIDIEAAEGDCVRLRVTDHGIGIPPHDQTRIFEPFQRAVSDRHYGGFGLGLWIVRQLVEAHGGTISVRSEPGSTTFTVELPKSGPEPPAEAEPSEARTH
jgi:PAS domain S-box-containing protein